MIRGSEEFAPPDRRRNIRQGDYLMLQGSHDDVQEFAAAHALTVHAALNQQKAFTHARTARWLRWSCRLNRRWLARRRKKSASTGITA